MKVLLLKDVRRLGHIGDVVDVATGYARNYLLPQRLGAAPTQENIDAIEDERKQAAAHRAKLHDEFTKLVERLEDVSVTIEATANPEGTLYGSVGSKEIADALNAQGFEVLPEHVLLDTPIRTLDNRLVPLEFTDEISAQVKVWVVREGGEEELEAEEPDETPDDEFDDDAD